MSQADLAKRSGLERSTVSRIVRGTRKPERLTLDCIAGALETTVDAITSGTDAAAVAAEQSVGAIPRIYFDEVIKKITELETSIHDRDHRLRSLHETIGEERDRRVRVDTQLDATKKEVNDLRDDLTRARAEAERERRRADELEEGLGSAIAELNVLRAKLQELKDAVGAGTSTSTVGAILAGVAAVAGVVTAASFLRPKPNESEDRESESKPEDAKARRTP